MIPIENLETMFANIREKTEWNIDGAMLWGYFFMDPSEVKLNRVGEHLRMAGYRFVGIHRTEDDSTSVLHVERVETHTPDTLNERNVELEELAYRLGVETYDGMDVGPVAS